MGTIIFINGVRNLVVKTPLLSQSPSFSPAHDFLPYSMPLQQPIIIYSGPTVEKFITLLLVHSYFFFCTKQKKYHKHLLKNYDDNFDGHMNDKKALSE